MAYEKPTVQKVEFDFKTRIAASGCDQMNVFDCDEESIND